MLSRICKAVGVVFYNVSLQNTCMRVGGAPSFTILAKRAFWNFSIAYIGPSVTPFSHLNPGYRIYEVDGDHENSTQVRKLILISNVEPACIRILLWHISDLVVVIACNPKSGLTPSQRNSERNSENKAVFLLDIEIVLFGLSCFSVQLIFEEYVENYHLHNVTYCKIDRWRPRFHSARPFLDGLLFTQLSLFPIHVPYPLWWLSKSTSCNVYPTR